MTATGEVVDLSAVAGQDTLLIDGVKVAKEQKMLAYSQTQPLPAGEKEVENRVEVPRGAEFCLSLADGSRVWLNSDSRPDLSCSLFKGFPGSETGRRSLF